MHAYIKDSAHTHNVTIVGAMEFAHCCYILPQRTRLLDGCFFFVSEELERLWKNHCAMIVSLMINYQKPFQNQYKWCTMINSILVSGIQTE